MTVAATAFRETARQRTSIGDVTTRLLASSAELSYDPDTEVAWDRPIPDDHYGLNPEWSTLYGTRLWDEMSEEQRVLLTRHEVGSIMQTGIWFEMMLQQLILRDQYAKNPADSEFRFALTEIADECRHSLMFARTCEVLGIPKYLPPRPAVELARLLKTTAGAEQAYGPILIAEEILDVMQRDWMRGENVVHIVRTTSKIHVVEEARHMKFARAEILEGLRTAGRLRREWGALLFAGAAFVIVRSMVSPEVYTNVGLDKERALAEVSTNQHRKAMMRLSCVHLMDFLAEARLLTKRAMPIYQSVNMI
ncbi:diiron oxygenase [Mumia sp. zg.B53]|uniref:AurF N-oxygenase family protein n=1 Tax=unclassified Mumia TaxID=2621872 RepID=UPI001C6DF2DF|nr:MULTISPECIES: diiron oxygenase [unclassified Mumia]MBW9204569.1 diiron oxygenase [Mumia sp. zg.B17]MBW9209426.1 diiron oxygenase [Mumia sp. zg.B21]MBW9214031.1 diiron oxygenase [Mumia sp. zg.B53]